MPTIEAILQIVNTHADLSVDQALAAALPTADPMAQRLLCESLLARHRPLGRSAIIAHYHRLDPALQPWVAARCGDWAVDLSLSISQGQVQPAVNALALMLEARAYHLAYLLPTGLRSPEPTIQIHTADTLARFIRQMAVETIPGPARRELVRVAVEAAALYDGHRQAAVLQALLAPLSAGDGVSMMLAHADRLLQDPRHAVVAALRQRLTQADDPAIRQALPALMLTPTLREDAGAAFRQSRVRHHHPDGFADPHLLLLPALRATVRGLPVAGELLPTPAELAVMSPPAQRALAAWLRHLPLEPAQRLAALGQMTHAGDDLARLLAVRVLMETAWGSSLPAALEALESFALDPAGPTAVLALRHLLRHRFPGLLKLLPRLANSPHAKVRWLAGHYLAPLAFDRFWTAWPRLSEEQRLSAGQAQIKIDPDFAHRLGQRLHSGPRSQKVRAMAMIATLGQGVLYEPALLRLLQDKDHRLAASAVRALETAPTPAVISALQQCLDHADARVRANAVEALEHLSQTDHAPRLREMARQDAGRPRANAIGALLRMHDQEAVVLLDAMLADQRANQRTSALWVVEKLGISDAARHVAELALVDPDPQVRERAERVIGQLLEIMRPRAAG